MKLLYQKTAQRTLSRFLRAYLFARIGKRESLEEKYQGFSDVCWCVGIERVKHAALFAYSVEDVQIFEHDQVFRGRFEGNFYIPRDHANRQGLARRQDLDYF